MNGTLDKSFQETMKKFDILSNEMEKTRDAIVNLQNVIVHLDNQNRKLQWIGVLVSLVAVTNVIVPIIGFVI